jgi:hypothetical protein
MQAELWSNAEKMAQITGAIKVKLKKLAEAK